MPKIIDPSFLSQALEVTFNSTTKTIKLNIAGNLSTDGVSMQAVYSFAKEQWKTDANLIKFPFPIVAITEQKFDLVNGWDFFDLATRNLIRDAGWALKDAANVSLEEYMGFISLGSVGTLDQIYYQQAAGIASSDVVLKGAANQAIKIYGDASRGAFDYRNFFKCFIREQAKIYDQSELLAIGLSKVTYQVYAFPLGNAPDLKITATDAAIDTAASIYAGMTITYFATPQARTIGGTAYNFNVIINGNGGTKNQIYEYVQRQLRKNVDIDAGTGVVTGKTANTLLKFIGDTLVTSQGIFIDSLASIDINSVEYFDNTNTKRVFPFVAAGTIQFNENLINDPDAIYRVYFTSTPTTTFGLATALLVKNNALVDLSGLVSARASISFTFDYDGNVQGGRTAGTDASITIVAIGLNSGQYVRTTGVITKSNANAFSVVSTLERNYSNPI